MNAMLTETVTPTVQHEAAGKGRIVNVLGCRLTPKSFCREEHDPVFLFECFVPPGGGPPLHTHRQWEGFYILDGEIEFSYLEA